jgi:hypothetical protein
MEAFSPEALDQTSAFLDRVGKTDRPSFVCFNTTAQSMWSHPQNKCTKAAAGEGRAETPLDWGRARRKAGALFVSTNPMKG